MKSTFILLISEILLFVIPLQAYIILDSKTEVSPGCEGGILSHRCTSSINNVNKLNESNFDEPNSFDENLDPSDKEETHDQALCPCRRSATDR